MLPRKYAGDYTLENVLDADGKVRTVGVYTGPWFRFRSDAETVRRTKHMLCASAALCAAAVLVPLLVLSPMLRLWYVMIPLALAVIPTARLAYCSAVLARKERFTRRERDTLVSALAPWSGAVLILALLSLLGQLVYALAGGAYALAEAGVTLAVLALGAAALRILSLRTALATEETSAE